MKNVLTFFFLILSVFFLSGFVRKVTQESYRIIVSYEDSVHSSSSKEGKAYGQMYIRAKVIEKTGKRSFVRKGPYNISVGADVEGYSEDAKPSEIIVKTAELRLINNDASVKKINLNIDRAKWVERYKEYKSGKRLRHRLWVNQHLEDVVINFSELKEVVFYIEFDVKYEDGAIKSYWSKKVAYPKYTKEKYNPFIKNIMSV